jgi:hypothetical protein
MNSRKIASNGGRIDNVTGKKKEKGKYPSLFQRDDYCLIVYTLFLVLLHQPGHSGVVAKVLVD